MSVIQEFHSDHRKVIQALFQLRQSIAARNINEIRTIVAEAEPLLAHRGRVGVNPYIRRMVKADVQPLPNFGRHAFKVLLWKRVGPIHGKADYIFSMECR